MNSFRQTLKSPVWLLGMVLLITPAVCLIASAEQRPPKALIPTLASALPLAAQIDQEVTQAGCDDSGCGNRCTSGGGSDCCEMVCRPKRVVKEVKKHCWNVKPEHVCIPGFRWPWERGCRKKTDCCGEGCDGGSDCCTPVCGRVRWVNVLEKHETTCEKCGYEWNVQCVRSSNSCRSCSRSDCPSCGQKSSCDR